MELLQNNPNILWAFSERHCVSSRLVAWSLDEHFIWLWQAKQVRCIQLLVILFSLLHR